MTCATDAIWPVELRWREERIGRGHRLAQPVRIVVSPKTLAGIVGYAASRVHGGEFELTMASGAVLMVHGAELERWASDPTGLPREMPDTIWRVDMAHMSEVAEAIEGFRKAMGGLVAAGVLAPAAAQCFVERFHVAIASLPLSALSLWRP